MHKHRGFSGYAYINKFFNQMRSKKVSDSSQPSINIQLTYFEVVYDRDLV